MQTITITGFLSRDAEKRQTQRGDDIANWNVPVKQGFGDSEQTNWFRVSIWGKRADYASRARKGDFVCVTGDLSIGEYQGKPQYEIRASDFSAVSRTPRTPDGSQGSPSQISVGGGSSDGFGYGVDLDDDIPFVRSDGMF